jgi:hypothetical protein
VTTATPQPTPTRTPAAPTSAAPQPTVAPTSTPTATPFPVTPSPTSTPGSLVTVTLQGQELNLTLSDLPWTSIITTVAAYSVSVSYALGADVCRSLVSSAGISQADCGGVGGGDSYPPFVEPPTYTACVWQGTDPTDRPPGC